MHSRGENPVTCNQPGCTNYLLSCMHRPVQPKSISWWGEVGNSHIFQHSPSRGGSLRPQTWNRSEQQLFYLTALTRIRTRDLWLWYYIELHAPTNSTQKLKLMGRGGQFTYIPTLPLTWRLPQTSDVEYERATIILFNCANQDSNSRPLALVPYWVACTDQFNPKA